MKRGHEVKMYAWIFSSIVVLDRITKWLVLRFLENEYRISSWISFDLVVNRGISWGMFHSTNQAMFILLTTLVVGVAIFFMAHAHTRWHANYTIYGEVMVIAGAVSNIIDRFLYHGVIDFIEVTTGGYVWPAFNVADMAIFIGVLVMLIHVYSDRELQK